LTLRLQAAQKKALEARRPLDHKKLLDILIDEKQDKYVELLEGTRSHTANIDDYIKRLATALEDDFNTQFYFPAFREVREASGLPTSSQAGGQTGNTSMVRGALPGLSRSPDERMLAQLSPGDRSLGTPLEALIPEPAVYKFETGTGFEIRPVIQPDGQSVVFN